MVGCRGARLLVQRAVLLRGVLGTLSKARMDALEGSSRALLGQAMNSDWEEFADYVLWGMLLGLWISLIVVCLVVGR